MMMSCRFTLLIFLLSLLQPLHAQDTICVSLEEQELYQLLNQYRKGKGLASIPLSPALTKVAQAHVLDLMENYEMSKKCNMHSWSDQGEWSSCCYTDDHQQAECMWNKPREIADYPSAGYEIAHWHSMQASPKSAIEGWKTSTGHNQVMINAGQWKSVSWSAVGVGIYQQYAVIWFGELEDDQTQPGICD